MTARFTEAVLSSMIVDDATRDALLGDLAEEWAQRADAAGVESADRWYVGQAFRAAPPLLADWFRQRSLAGVLGAATGVLVAGLASALMGVVTALAVAAGLHLAGADPWSVVIAAAAASAAWTFLTAYLVVRAVRTAPLPLLFWLALIVFVTSFSPLRIAGGQEYLVGFLLMEKAFSMAGAFGGGLLALLRRQPAESPC